MHANFFVVDYQNLRVNIADVNDVIGGEKVTNAFYKKAEVVILKQAYNRIDFNHDGFVDGKDLSSNVALFSCSLKMSCNGVSFMNSGKKKF